MLCDMPLVPTAQTSGSPLQTIGSKGTRSRCQDPDPTTAVLGVWGAICGEAMSFMQEGFGTNRVPRE